MRTRTRATFLFLLLCSGCAPSENAAPPADSTGGAAPRASYSEQAASKSGGAEAEFKQVSLTQAEAGQSAPAVAERKIIRNATLALEVESPSRSLPRVASIAESLGGYVVTSESRQRGGEGGRQTYEVVTAQLRVPAARFDEALNQLRAVGGRVTEEKIGGQDVTEEYIDLEARLRTQRALEAQFLEIMKSADEVAEALQVQRELANVRTEIERVEGRRRFLESQVSLSTINVTLSPPDALVNTSGFFSGLREAFGDGLGAAVTVTLGLVRVALALIPLVLFVVLPLFLLARYVRRRLRRRTVAE